VGGCRCCDGGAGGGLRFAAASNDLVTDSDQTKADRAAQLHMELAAAYFGRGNNEAALDDVKKVLAAKPDSSAAYNLRGLIYASMDQNDLAEQFPTRDADQSARF
jgi:type IV pilus assembly protein PilF